MKNYNLFDIRFWALEWASPWMLLILLLIPFLIVLYVMRNKEGFAIKGGANYSNPKRNYGLGWLKHLFFALKLTALALFILSLAKPFSKTDQADLIKQNYKGIDIVIAMDISWSMLALDFKPNRLESAKNLAIDFVNGRINDRISLVVYEGEAYTKCPLTTDYKVLNKSIPEMYPGTMKDGTAIGTGLATAINRLKSSKSKSKVIILLTDGENNSGEISPLKAAEFAKEFGIKVYTIGLGRNGIVPFPTRQGGTGAMESVLDEEMLKLVAKETGGLYFYAPNEKALKEIYDQIDQLEKTEIKTIEFEMDPPTQHYGFLFIGLIGLVIIFILESIFLKSITH